MKVLKERKVYPMIDDIPIWKHLMNNGYKKIDITLNGSHFGRIAEMLGSYYLSKATRMKYGGKIFNEIFPSVEILSTKRLCLKRQLGLGDRTYEVDCRNNGKYSKKIVIFEIKNGKVSIEQPQIRRYCEAILNPSKFIRKAEELKVFFLMFDKIDTLNANASFNLCELTPEFAKKIIEHGEVSELGQKSRTYDFIYKIVM